MGLRRLAREALPHLHLLASGTLCLLLSTLAELMLSRTAGSLLDLLGSRDVATRMAEVDALFWQLAGYFAVIAVIKHLGEYFLKLAGERLVASLRKDLYLALLRQRVSFFDEWPTGELITILWHDVEAVHLACAYHLPDVVRFSIGCACSAAGMALISVRITLAAACVAPLIGLLASVVGAYVTRLAREYREHVGVATAVANEGLSAARVVKSFGQEEAMAHRFGAAVDECAARSLREMAVHKCWNCSNLSMAAAACLILLRAAGVLLARGELSAGDIVQLGLFGIGCGNNANDAANAYAKASASAAKGAKALEMLDEVAIAAAREAESTAAKRSKARELFIPGFNPDTSGLSVHFDNVCFAYPLLTGNKMVHPAAALTDLTFHARPGLTTALVGPSGGGKSTILNLILRFYQPDSGRIQLNVSDLSGLSTAWLRDAVSIVPQEATLFRGTISENIAFGLPSKAAKEWSAGECARAIISAANAANAHAFIQEAGGYKAHVGERGGTLSGGQRQRIAVARALLRQPRLLLLDEATAALDTESEKAVQSALAAVPWRPTKIVVAHRLTTIVEADSIVVLSQGRVVEVGRHAELVKKGGLYSRLATSLTT